VTRVNNCDKPIQIGNPNIKPSTQQQRHDEKQGHRYLSANVNRMKKDRHSQTNEQQNPNFPFLTSPRSSRISVVILPQNKISPKEQINRSMNNLPDTQNINQRLRRSSVGSVKVTKADGRASRFTQNSANSLFSAHHKINLDK
jgi:hypothetical protein